MASSNNKRIAKNTLLLYFRMLITMGVSLYTSRIVLNTLGVEDYGIYNVVGGVVVMLGFLNSAMSSGTQRFLSFELGKKDKEQLAKVFSMSLNIHAIIALVIFILAETAGLWFLNTKLNIPAERMNAANWVYQFSVFTFMVSVLNVPYNALIIAHERMNVYAYVSIVEVSLKLFIVFVLHWYDFDKLKLFAILIFMVSLLIRIIYGLYSRKNFKESKYLFFWDISLYKTLMSFAGWNLFGNFATVLSGQGVNILLNIFFGPVVNAARGIAFQVKGAVFTFMQNFQLAVNPQIIKSFASKDLKYMHQLIFQSAKFSFFLMFLLSVPILLETAIILKLWLKIVPEFTIIFTQLAIINILIDSVTRPLMTAAQASGKIRLYQTITGGLLLLILPLSWIFLKFGYPPEVTLYIGISISSIIFLPILKIVSSLVSLSINQFIKNVFFKIIPVAVISIIPSLLVKNSLEPGLLRLIILVMVSSVSIAVTIYLIGLTHSEKAFISNLAVRFFKKVNLLFNPA